MSEPTTTNTSSGDFEAAAKYADHLAWQARYIRPIILAEAERTNQAARVNHVGLLPEIADLLDQAAALVQEAGRKAKEAQVAFTERAAWQRDAERRPTLTEEMNTNLAAAANGLVCDMMINCRRPVTMIDAKGYVYCTEHGLQRRTVMPCRKLRPAELAKLARGEQIAKY